MCLLDSFHLRLIWDDCLKLACANGVLSVALVESLGTGHGRRVWYCVEYCCELSHAWECMHSHIQQADAGLSCEKTRSASVECKGV